MLIGAAAPAPAPVSTSVADLSTVSGGPHGIQIVVVGQVNGGVFTGHEVSGGVPVYAGVGNPTTWVTGFDIHTLPNGTPLGVAFADRAHIQ